MRDVLSRSFRVFLHRGKTGSIFSHDFCSRRGYSAACVIMAGIFAERRTEGKGKWASAFFRRTAGNIK